MKKKNFILKVTIIHVVTYIVCGMLSMILFDYQSSVEQIGMRDTNSLIVSLAPLFQIFRGFLFGIVLWIIRDVFLSKKNGWFIIWIMILILGVFNTPATAPCSIEYFIYCEPISGTLKITLGGLTEILIQTFLFSILSFYVIKHEEKRA